MVAALSDERIQLEKQRYIYEQHIAGNKRQNLIKKACMAIVSGINPYIDRILNEVHKLTEKGYIDDAKIKKEKYQYIDELVTTINEYNDILALWIKMKQGTLSLNIETFSLNELFDLLGKGRRAFEMKKQKLEIESTTLMVKADRALTLFMINTLAENARKYTPGGGMVKVYAHATDAYVEISVEDNGRGLSAEDIAHIIGEKVYDSRAIGMKRRGRSGRTEREIQKDSLCSDDTSSVRFDIGRLCQCVILQTVWRRLNLNGNRFLRHYYRIIPETADAKEENESLYYIHCFGLRRVPLCFYRLDFRHNFRDRTGNQRPISCTRCSFD